MFFKAMLGGLLMMSWVAGCDKKDPKTEGTAGGSGTANSSAVAGTSGASPDGGVKKPTVEELQRKSIAQLDSIQKGILLWANGHDDKYPDTLATLAAEKFVNDSDLKSPFGAMVDGGGDVWFLSNAVKGDLTKGFRRDLTLGAGYVVLYDRSSYARGDKVVVGFGDGRVEAIARDDFAKAIEKPQKAFGVDYGVPVK